MLPALATLLLCQLAGEAVVHVAALPIPGPVVGMVLLFGLLLIRAPLPAATGDTADGMLNHLSLLFVPAGVGVVQHLELIGGEGVRLLVIIVLSTVIALAVTALVFAAVARALGQSGEPENPESAA
jgi:holin-like protein